MKKYSCSININDLQRSKERISSIEDFLNSNDLENYYIEIEEIIKKTNFEHGNCINNYKNKITNILSELSDIKRKISHLNSALDITTKSFSDKEELNSEDIKQISQLYNGSINRLENNLENGINLRINSKPDPITSINLLDIDKEVIKIPPNNTEQATTVIEEKSTVPIGLGIAATGITASIGAVVYDDIKRKRKFHLADYKGDDKKSKPITEIQEEQPTHEFDIIDSYHASRNKRRFDKFYGENNEYYENEK